MHKIMLRKIKIITLLHMQCDRIRIKLQFHNFREEK